MLTIKEAVNKIKATVVELFGDDIKDIRLEEMELNNEEKSYKLTISFLVPNNNVSTMASLFSQNNSPYIREYKNVIINNETGEISSIKIKKNE